MARDYIAEVVAPAQIGHARQDPEQIHLALDAAVAFGILEFLDGNAQVADRAKVEAMYKEKCEALRVFPAGTD